VLHSLLGSVSLPSPLPFYLLFVQDWWFCSQRGLTHFSSRRPTFTHLVVFRKHCYPLILSEEWHQRQEIWTWWLGAWAKSVPGIWASAHQTSISPSVEWRDDTIVKYGHFMGGDAIHKPYRTGLLFVFIILGFFLYAAVAQVSLAFTWLIWKLLEIPSKQGNSWLISRPFSVCLFIIGVVIWDRRGDEVKRQPKESRVRGGQPQTTETCRHLSRIQRWPLRDQWPRKDALSIHAIWDQRLTLRQHSSPS
jgi:hypothetical protein